MTPAIKISRKLLELILFSKFKCECLLTPERTPTLNIELGQIDPKATGGLNKIVCRRPLCKLVHLSVFAACVTAQKLFEDFKMSCYSYSDLNIIHNNQHL